MILFRVLLVACALFLTGAAANPARAQGGRKLALIVTVSVLKNQVAPDLRGPLNDAPQMRRLLIDRYGFAGSDIESIEKTSATKANIIAAFERLIARAKPDDLVVFYYSGHGVPVADQAPLDETDGFDEALVPYDANNDANGDPDPKTVFRDDEMGDFLKRIPTKNVVVLLDACHSGTGTRGGGTPKRWMTVKSKKAANPDEDAPALSAGGDTLGSDLTGPVVLTAAAASETARDSELLRPVSDDGNPNIGAFTFTLLDTVNRRPGETMTYRQVYVGIANELRRLGFKQTPQLEGAGLDAPFLALPDAAPTPNPLPPPTPGGGQSLIPISQARVLGVSGATLQLQRVGGGRFVKGSLFSGGGTIGAVTVRVDQTGMGGLEASASVTQGTASTALVGQTLAQTAFPPTREPLRIAVTGDKGGAAETVSTMIREVAGVRLVEQVAERDVDLEIKTRTGGQITLTPVRKQIPLVPLSAPNVTQLRPALTGMVENLQALSSLLQLENPNPSFSLDLKVNGQSGGDVLRVGDTVEFTVRASEDCFVYLIDVDPAGKVTVLFPNKLVSNNRLRAGQTYPMPTPDVYRLRVQGPPGPEVLKAIATRKPIRLPTLDSGSRDFAALSAPALTISRALWQELRLALGVPAGSGGSETVATLFPTAGWASATVFLQVEAARP